MVVVDVCGQTYHMDPKIKKVWDGLKDGKIAKFDEDRFYIADGHEGAGKSLYVIQQAAYIDPTILNDERGKSMPRICFTADDFLYAIRHTKSTKSQTKVVVWDEAFRGMSSKSALSGINKKIVQALMEARQNNLIVFIVSPSFYLLEFYPAVLRSKALFHVVKEKNSRKRYVRVFNYKKKAILYQIGVRKGWGYPLHTKTRIRFFNIYPGGDEFEARYRKKKRDSLREDDKVEKKTHKWKKQRNAAIKILHSEGKTYKDISESMKKNGSVVGITTLHDICHTEGEDEKPQTNS